MTRGLTRKYIPTSTHWGNYELEISDNHIVAVHPVPGDPDPTEIGQVLLDSRDSNCRIPQPMIRKGYLKKQWRSDTSQRGGEPFVPVSWNVATEITAQAIERARTQYGNESIYGGSYGWASAGRFHHANSQVHRFLNVCGGYTSSVNSYSAAAAEVIMPHVLGIDFFTLMLQAPAVEDMVKHTKIALCFGGIAMKNTQVMAGGLGAHTARDQLLRLKEGGIQFINISPIKDDMADYLQAEWWPCRPNSDVAIMLGIAHTLVEEDLYDKAFIKTYCSGLDKFLPYLTGEEDGVVKNADWAAALSEVPAENILNIARKMAAERSLIGISWSLQRSESGEQPYWMATLLSALLGHVGLPGGGVAYGYGSVHNIGFAGRRLPNFKTAALSQGKNQVETYIPVARITDMLLNPGKEFQFNGKNLTYPEIKLIYWAGGNPFHHHQDLNRLRRAWQKPQTVIVHDAFWTASARQADIVLPCTTTLERNDISISPYDCHITPMPKALPPFEQSRDDYDIFAAIADHLGLKVEFTEGRTEMEWLIDIYNRTRDAAIEADVELPDFEAFWSGKQLSLFDQIPNREFILEKFRKDPVSNALKTTSGKIELFSETIASYGYDDCIGHPKWYEKEEWLGAKLTKQFPLHLISNQPKHRLHSQYDHSRVSRQAKINGRAPARMHPADATDRNILDGDVVRIFNARGSCLAGVIVTDRIRPFVIELETGAWYDSADGKDSQPLEIHGNPNVLTRDAGTSRLAQGPIAHSCLVEVEKYSGELPPVNVFNQPVIENA